MPTAPVSRQSISRIAASAFAKHQPVSITASAVRALVLGGPTATYIWQCLAWCAGIIAVFAPLAVRRYRHAV